MRVVYHIEEAMNNLRLHGLNAEGAREVAVFHSSTLDHLEILLETLLTRWPGVKLRISSPLLGNGLRIPSELLTDLTGRYDIEWSPLNEMAKADDNVDVSVLLFSPKASISQEVRRAIGSAFTKCGSKEKVILDGDGSAWKGDFRSRLVRRLFRALMCRLGPLRDRLEQRRIDGRLLPDPGPIAHQGTVCGHERRKRILSLPFVTEQCVECATVIKKLQTDSQGQEDIYHDEYHGMSVYDERINWTARLEEYQTRRLRNMRKVGFPAEADLGSEAKILDIGCGTGGLTAALNGAGFDVLGIDICEAAIEKAQATFPGARFRCIRFEDLSLMNDPPFDGVVLSHVLEHAQNDVELLKRARTLLNPNGLIYVEVPWLDAQAIRHRPYWYRQSDHYREYSKQGLARLVAGCGYTILEHEDSLREEDREPHQFLLACATVAQGAGIGVKSE